MELQSIFAVETFLMKWNNIYFLVILGSYGEVYRADWNGKVSQVIYLISTLFIGVLYVLFQCQQNI